MSQEVAIRPFTPADAPAFHDLNMAWLNAYFHVEPKDEAALSDPEGTILAPGGMIFIAEANGTAVGCVALPSAAWHCRRLRGAAADGGQCV